MVAGAFSAAAKIRAIDVLPTPRVPVKKIRVGDSALGDGVGEGAWRWALGPTTPSKLVERYRLAKER